MRKKRTLVIGGSITAAVIAVATTAIFLVKHEPKFYHAVEVPPSDERVMLSAKFSTGFYQLLEQIRHGTGNWAFSFTQNEMNSFFSEGYIHLNEAKAWKSKFDISQPRVRLENNTMSLGFYYGSGVTKCLISLDLKIWLVPKEVNLIALEIVRYRAGAIPISTRSLMDRITEFARAENIEINWHRHQRNAVALMRLQADRSRPTFHLHHLELHDGKMLISGVSYEPLERAKLEMPNPQNIPVVPVSGKVDAK